MNKFFIYMGLCLFSSIYAMEDEKHFPSSGIIKMYLDYHGYSHFAEKTEIHLKLDNKTLNFADYFTIYNNTVEKYISSYFSDDPHGPLLLSVYVNIGNALIASTKYYSHLQKYMQSQQAANGESKPST